MRISDEEVRKLLHQSGIVAEISAVYYEREQSQKAADEQLVHEVVEAVMAMPDREDFVADLKARIEAGTYNPSGDEIAEAMIRRTIADRIR